MMTDKPVSHEEAQKALDALSFDWGGWAADLLDRYIREQQGLEHAFVRLQDEATSLMQDRDRLLDLVEELRRELKARCTTDNGNGRTYCEVCRTWTWVDGHRDFCVLREEIPQKQGNNWLMQQIKQVSKELEQTPQHMRVPTLREKK